MKLKHAIKISAISASLMLLVACSTTGSGTANGAAGPYQGTTTMGLGGPDTIAGLNTSTSPFRMKAPYNQIYFFDFDKSAIHSDDLGSIDVQGNYLAAHPSGSVLLTGNTDERGSREYNIALGERRALSVASRLEMDGTKQSQIQVVSYGAEKPIVPGHNEAAWAQNRNVQLMYQSK